MHLRRQSSKAWSPAHNSRRLTASAAGVVASPQTLEPAERENVLEKLSAISDLTGSVANEMQVLRDRIDKLSKFAEPSVDDKMGFPDVCGVEPSRIFGQLMALRSQMRRALQSADNHTRTTETGLTFLDKDKDAYRNSEKTFQKTQKEYLLAKISKSPEQQQQEEMKYMAEKRAFDLQRFRLSSKLEEVKKSADVGAGTYLIQVLGAFADILENGFNMLPAVRSAIETAKAVVRQKEDQWAARQTSLDMLQAELEQEVDRPVPVPIRAASGIIRDLSGGDVVMGARNLRGTLFTYPVFAPVPVVLQDNVLTIHYESGLASVPCLLCSVKESREHERRYLFCVVTPQKTHLLQADSATDMQKWISAIQGAIMAALNATSISSTDQKDENQTVQTLWANCPQNRMCADCEAPDPDWCVINMGCLICMACSGHHRNLGVHISKVRSLRLDKASKTSMAFLLAMGNKLHNQLWEAALPNFEEFHRKRRDEFIKAKYEQKLFMHKTLPQTALQALESKNYPGLLAAVVLGDDINIKIQGQAGRTILHLAVENEDSVAMELLIQNDADVRAEEDRGWTPLSYASFMGNSDAVRALLERGGSHLLKLVDLEGQSALDIAKLYNAPKSDTVQILQEFVVADDAKKAATVKERTEKGADRVLEAKIPPQPLPTPKKKGSIDWKPHAKTTAKPGTPNTVQTSPRGPRPEEGPPVEELVLFQGLLQKKSPTGNNRFQERYFELFPSTLVYRKKKGGDVAGEIRLCDVQDGRYFDRPEKKGGEFELDVKTAEAEVKKHGPVRTFTMFGSAVDTSAWLKAILRQVEACKQEAMRQSGS